MSPRGGPQPGRAVKREEEEEEEEEREEEPSAPARLLSHSHAKALVNAPVCVSQTERLWQRWDVFNGWSSQGSAYRFKKWK